MGWQWHQLEDMQIMCTSLQPDNHDGTSSCNVLQAGRSCWCPANSVNELKATRCWFLALLTSLIIFYLQTETTRHKMSVANLSLCVWQLQMLTSALQTKLYRFDGDSFSCLINCGSTRILHTTCNCIDAICNNTSD